MALVSQLQTKIGGLLDASVEAFNDYLSSRKGFLHALLITVFWVPLVVWSIDPHGFIYLYIATAFGVITQFTLALISLRAKRAAEAADARIYQLLENDAAQMQLQWTLTQEIKQLIERIEDLAVQIHTEQVEQTEILEDLGGVVQLAAVKDLPFDLDS